MKLLVAEGSERVEDRAKGGIGNDTKNQPASLLLQIKPSPLQKHVIVSDGGGAEFAPQNSSDCDRPISNGSSEWNKNKWSFPWIVWISTI